MKKVSILLLLLIAVLGIQNSFAQKSHHSGSVHNEETDTICTSPDQMPKFPGGLQAMYEYIDKNMKYPESARKDYVQGRTYCHAVINKDGSVSDVVVVKSSGRGDLDEEAVRIVSNMPLWDPALLEGKEVRAICTIPVTFRIASAVKKK